MSEELNNIEGNITDLSTEQKENMLANFGDFSGYLKNQLASGEKFGISDEILAKGAKYVMEHLSNGEGAKTLDSKLLLELLKGFDKDGGNALSSILAEIVKGK